MIQVKIFDEEHEFLPRLYTTNNCIAYTGSHDSDCTKTWAMNLSYEARDRFNKECPQIGSSDTYSLIEFAFNSIANLVIIPIQDYLELTNEEGRMNTPSTPEGSWGYRIENNYNNDELKNKIKDIVIRTNRM